MLFSLATVVSQYFLCYFAALSPPALVGVCCQCVTSWRAICSALRLREHNAQPAVPKRRSPFGVPFETECRHEARG